jgi:hypothetical protein
VNTVAAVLAMHYTLQTAKSRDKTGLMRVLPILANAVKGSPFEDAFMHCLVTALIQVRCPGEGDQLYVPCKSLLA